MKTVLCVTGEEELPLFCVCMYVLCVSLFCVYVYMYACMYSKLDVLANGEEDVYIYVCICIYTWSACDK